MSQEATAGDPIERKVQLAGNSTYVVSLPKPWALEQGLESGSSMYLYPHEDRLVAATETVSTHKRCVEIAVTDRSESSLARTVEAAYLIGCDRLAVTGLETADPSVRRTIERTVSGFVGVAIDSDDGDRITITDVLDTSDVSLPQTVAQARQLVLELYADAIEAYVTGDTDRSRRATDRLEDLNRLVSFVARGTHRGLSEVTELDRLGTDRLEAFQSYRIMMALEHLASHAVDIARLSLEGATLPADSLGDRFESVGDDARTLLECALSGETKQVYEERPTVLEAIDDLGRHATDVSEPTAAIAIDRLRRTVALLETIADIQTQSALADSYRRPSTRDGDR